MGVGKRLRAAIGVIFLGRNTPHVGNAIVLLVSVDVINLERIWVVTVMQSPANPVGV